MPDALANATVGGPAAPEAAPAAPQLPSPFSDVLAGTVPAVSLAPIHGRKTDPAQEFVVQNMDELAQAGIDYHELPDHHSVLFNPAKISSEQLDSADKAGKLFDVAPLVTKLGASTGANADLAPAGASPAQPVSGPALAGATATGPVEGKLKSARLRAAAAPAIGAGDPVSALSKRAV